MGVNPYSLLSARVDKLPMVHANACMQVISLTCVEHKTTFSRG